MMRETFTIGVATYGDESWYHLARERAIPSAVAQGVRVIHEHGDTLAEARNELLELTHSEFLIYLDADDELEPGYVKSMASGTADLRAPRLRQIHKGKRGRPFMPRVWGHTHLCTGSCLREGNWCVIGTAVRADLLRQVGGWEEWGWSEDWAAWARCWNAGGSVEGIRRAIYVAHVRQDSRNHGNDPVSNNDWHRQIAKAIWGQA